MPFASLVPASTPLRIVSRRGIPGVGPMRIASIEGARRIVLRRNPHFSLPGVPPASGHVVRIVVNARRFDLEDDAVLPRPPHSRMVELGATFYFFLNQRTWPFDRREVRQAVNLAFDRRTVGAASDGLIQPSCTFLPPLVMPERAAEPCPYGDMAAAPQVDRARQMIAAAGASGASVTVYGINNGTSRPVTEAFVASLNDIGLRARARFVEGERYFSLMGRQRTRAQAGFTYWFQDFPHPGNFFFLLDPDSIQRTNNQNFGNVDDPVIKSELDRLDSLPLADALSGYAALDRRVVEEGYVVPFGVRMLPVNFTARVPPECVVFHPVIQVDFSRLCVT